METAPLEQRAVVERLRAIGISESYASQLARSIRPPSKPLAIDIFRRTGMKLGPIADLTEQQIDVLETVVGRGKAKGRAS